MVKKILLTICVSITVVFLLGVLGFNVYLTIQNYKAIRVNKVSTQRLGLAFNQLYAQQQANTEKLEEVKK